MYGPLYTNYFFQVYMQLEFEATFHEHKETSLLESVQKVLEIIC